MRKEAADRDAGIAVEQWQNCIPDRAADDLELDVDAIWTGLCQDIGKFRCATIDRRVKPEFLANVRAFGLTFSDSDRTRAGEACKLTDK